MTLTPRERDIVTCLRQGLSAPKIAKALGISVGTVKVHVKHIYERNDIHGRAELLAREEAV